MKKTFRKAISALALAMASLGSAHATIIQSTSTALGGSLWRYDYVLTNDTLAVPVEGITLFFDHERFGALHSANGPTGWDLLLIQPDQNLPAAGFMDALALSGGILPGAVSASFSVVVDVLGASAPASQQFTIYDPLSFATIDAGTTTSAAIPLPATGLLIGAGALAMALARRRHRPAALRHLGGSYVPA